MNEFTDDLDQFVEEVEILKALAHPVRICIVSGLIAEGSRNVSEMQGCLNIPRSTL